MYISLLSRGIEDQELGKRSFIIFIILTPPPQKKKNYNNFLDPNMCPAKCAFSQQKKFHHETSYNLELMIINEPFPQESILYSIALERFKIKQE